MHAHGFLDDNGEGCIVTSVRLDLYAECFCTIGLGFLGYGRRFTFCSVIFARV